MLTEDMVTCDVTKKSRYGVESYDYTIKYRLEDNYVAKNIFTHKNNDEDGDVHTSKKRRHADRSNVKLRLGKRAGNQDHSSKQQPRILPDLMATSDNPVEVIASEIAENLAEEKKELVGELG